jgi:hypothetical protein
MELHWTKEDHDLATQDMSDNGYHRRFESLLVGHRTGPAFDIGLFSPPSGAALPLPSTDNAKSWRQAGYRYRAFHFRRLLPP